MKFRSLIFKVFKEVELFALASPCFMNGYILIELLLLHLHD